MKLPIDLNPITDGIRSIQESMLTIRDSIGLLPEVAKTLEEIRKGMDFMGSEVHRMRLGVDELTVEVAKMVDGVEPLEGKLVEVSGHIERLEPKLDELRDTLHPLRRVGKRMGRRRDDLGSAEVENGDGDLDGELLEPLTGELDQIESGEKVSQAEGSPES
ncbi:hypothetical protein BH10ACT11_BH10ACT11_19380 [soil metagenome]